MIRTVTAALALSLLTMASASPAAMMITQSQGFIGQPNLVKTVEFAQFNPANGTLQGVEWRLDLRIEGGQLTVDNDGQLPASVSIQLGAVGSISSTDVALVGEDLQPVLSGLSAVTVSTGTEFNLAGDDGDGPVFDPSVPDAATHNGGVASETGMGTVNSLFLNGYIGTDMFDVNIDLVQLLDFGGVGGVSGQFDPVLAEPQLTLTYHYVPEPNALGLLGTGLLLAFAVGRYRSAN